MKKIKSVTKERSYKIGILAKLLIPTLITIIILSIVLSILSFSTQKKNLINDGIKSAILFAKIGISMVGGYTFEEVKDTKDPENDAYKTTYEVFEKIKKSSNVEYMYTVFLEDGKLCYGVDIDDNEETRRKIGDIYESVNNSNIEYETIANGEIYYDTEFSYFNGKPYISAIIPVLSESGEVIGGVGCDYAGISITNRLNSTVKKIVTVMLIAIVLSTIIIVFIMKKIVKNINVVNEKMVTLISNEGDLTQEIVISSGDEIELISNNTNNFLKTIREMIINMLRYINELKTKVNRFFTDMKDAKDNVSEVDDTLKELNIDMESVVSECSMITELSNEIEGFVDELNDFINTGVKKAIDINVYANNSSIDNKENYDIVKEKVNMLSNRLNEKLVKAKDISKISSLIGDIIDITDQTNLLALNASIEAARAGESGKGFVIVAEQISKLANMTGLAANQIHDVTNGIIASVDELMYEAEKMLKFMDDILVNGYNNLLDNSKVYEGDSKELKDIFNGFAQSTQVLLRNIINVQKSIELVGDNINVNAENIESMSNISSDLTAKMLELYGKVNDIKTVEDKLNLEVKKFKV